ncbi:unnamed protein product [Calypogeia fissa]
MEGDDAFELGKANADIMVMTATLNRVAFETAQAFNGTSDPPETGLLSVPTTSHASSSISYASPSIVNIADSISTSQSPSPSSSSSVVPEISPLGTPDQVNIRAEPILSTRVDLHCSIKENPLLDLDYLTEDELIEMNLSISYVDSLPLPTQHCEIESAGTEEPFVPLLPPRFLEWESSKEDGCMWQIKNINNLAPISLDMWQGWATISPNEVLQCRERALQEISLCDKAPVFINEWPMMVFGTPKYKCQVAVGAKIKGKLDCKNSRIKEHKSKPWNYHRPFFRCSCHYNAKTGCNGQIVWLDHAVWYMLNHLEDFLSANSIQGRLVMLIKFLSGDARKMVLDQCSEL